MSNSRTMDAHSASLHIAPLDGIRAISIILVLITHLFPVRLGGHLWNDSIGILGMALFFQLSGFLITSQILRRPSATDFLSRRLFRIVPSAWLCIATVSIFSTLDFRVALSHGLFYANIPPQSLARPLDHFWSLCIEVQFYCIAALLLLFPKKLSWWVIPLLLACVTILRIYHEVYSGSITWYRADDLLAGASLALIFSSKTRNFQLNFLRNTSIQPLLIALLIGSAILPEHGASNWLSYFRPYIGATLLASLIIHPRSPLALLLSCQKLRYIAVISYALYIWHPPLAATWLGTGDVLEKYLKRPLLILALIIASHLSTFYFEKFFNDIGRDIKRLNKKPLGVGN